MISQTEDRMVNNLSLQSRYSYRHIPVWSETLSSLIFVAQSVFKHLQQCPVHMLHLAISHRVIRCCSGTGFFSFFNWVNNWFLHSPPWSWWMREGNPNFRVKSLKMRFAAVFPDFDVVAYAWVEHVKLGCTHIKLCIGQDEGNQYIQVQRDVSSKYLSGELSFHDMAWDKCRLQSHSAQCQTAYMARRSGPVPETLCSLFLGVPCYCEALPVLFLCIALLGLTTCRLCLVCTAYNNCLS